jgi:hypothetical protein
MIKAAQLMSCSTRAAVESVSTAFLDKRTSWSFFEDFRYHFGIILSGRARRRTCFASF